MMKALWFVIAGAVGQVPQGGKIDKINTVLSGNWLSAINNGRVEKM